MERYYDLQPIKIGVPLLLERILKRDAEMFEVFIGRDERVDMNRFLNALVSGYYDRYKKELSVQEAGIRNALSPYISKRNELENVVSKLILETRSADVKLMTDGKPIRFRPTGEAVSIHAEIERDASGMNESLSGYYRNMLLSYSRLPVYERERVIYHKEARTIEEAYKEKKEIIFTGRDNPKAIHTVLPYGLVYGSDEQFNYLIGQEVIGKKPMACSYRLRRVLSPRPQKTEKTMDSQIVKYLEKMKNCDPQYSINEEIDTCVIFTEKGKKDFRRIYLGRPVIKRVDTPDANGSIKVYFSCSQEQLFNYFKRFNPGEATIIYPKRLKESLLHFHERHMEELK